MNKYIAFLRGINVSGKHLIKMDELKGLFEEIGFTAVKTYIQSGNILFYSNHMDKKDVENTIEAGIATRFNMTVPAIVLPAEALESYLEQNPYKDAPSGTLYFTFCKDMPTAALSRAFSDEDDKFMQKDSVIYLHIPNGYGRTKLNNQFFESKLKVICTTRNFQTCRKMLDL